MDWRSLHHNFVSTSDGIGAGVNEKRFGPLVVYGLQQQRGLFKERTSRTASPISLVFEGATPAPRGFHGSDNQSAVRHRRE